jgi:hypothetical protein
MPLQSTSGAASYDAFGGGVAAVPKYIEDYFSTFLFTGNASTQTITNGIDLAGKGGLVWTKNRTNAYDNYLYDTARGVNKLLLSNNTIDQQSTANTLTAFNSNGFTLGNNDYGNITNGAAAVSWTLAKAPKFFDVVTYTGNSDSYQVIPHNLGSAAGCVIVKRTDSTGDWGVWHRSTGTQNLVLNSTSAAGATYVDKISADATDITVVSPFKTSGATYVAYIFAHNAGGFGLTGTDNVISCGSFTTDGSGNATVNLGYEPQWVLWKKSDGPVDGYSSWTINDNMRGFTVDQGSQDLYPNRSDAEAGTGAGFGCSPTSTGFKVIHQASKNYIYIAIRRGPMKVPTSGTSVFNPVLASATAPALRSSNFNSGVDSGIRFYTAGYSGYPEWSSRLTGTGVLATSSTAAESTLSVNTWDYMNGYLNYAGLSTDFGSWMFKRAPSFFDEVCYTGNSTSGATQTHNLGVVPELMIVKGRSVNANWFAYTQTLGATKYLILNDTGGAGTLSSVWNDTAPTSTTFTLGNAGAVNSSGGTYVAYLFATCAGVSKCFSYTGNGSSQTINCGFTGGARWILIKRTDSTGDWYCWDSARGIVSGNDPHLSLNTTAAEVTSDDTIDTDSTGFVVNQVSATNVNVSSATYIGIAIA